VTTKYPKTEIIDHHLHVEGSPDNYVQGAIRTLWLTVTDLQCFSGYSSILSDDMKGGTRIAGTAEFQRSYESIRVAGVEGISTKKFQFSVRAATEGSYPEWTVMIGFNPGDREIGTTNDWWMECYAPREAFDKLLADFLDGKVNTISLGCKTDAWVTSADWYANVGDWVTWYLEPKEYSPEPARGKINQFSWELVPKIEKKMMPPLAPEDTDAYKMGQAYADETIRVAMAEASEKKPPAATGRAKWGYLIAVAVVIVAIWILR